MHDFVLTKLRLGSCDNVFIVIHSAQKNHRTVKLSLAAGRPSEYLKHNGFPCIFEVLRSNLARQLFIDVRRMKRYFSFNRKNFGLR
jgi:hypothetical protein